MSNAATETVRPSTKPKGKHSVAWHQENCACKGNPQPVSAVLASRREKQSSSGHIPNFGFFHKPGSQNRNK